MYEGREVSDELCSAIKRSENFMKIYLFLFVVCIYIYGNTTSTIILFIIKFEDCRFFQTIFYLHVACF